MNVKFMKECEAMLEDCLVPTNEEKEAMFL